MRRRSTSTIKNDGAFRRSHLLLFINSFVGRPLYNMEQKTGRLLKESIDATERASFKSRCVPSRSQRERLYWTIADIIVYLFHLFVFFICLFIYSSITSTIITHTIQQCGVWTKWPTQGQATYLQCSHNTSSLHYNKKIKSRLHNSTQ